MSNNLLYPAVGGAPGSAVSSKEVTQAPDRVIDRDPGAAGLRNTPERGENFSKILGGELSKPENLRKADLVNPNLSNPSLGGAVKEPLKFSAHASARLQSRNLKMGPEQMQKLNEAVDKAAAKGLDDTLVLTKDGAFIVSVSNRTVVTALDRNSLDGNVFTNIDGAVVM